MTFNFICFVCLEQMAPNNMMAISCGHVLCGSCYETMYLIRGEERICGLCRSRFGSGLKLFLNENIDTLNSQSNHRQTIRNDDNSNMIDKMEKLELELETEKCISESLKIELKEKQLEMIEQKTIGLALKREIEENHIQISTLNKKISEYQCKENNKEGDEGDINWLLNILNETEEEKVKALQKQEKDYKIHEAKLNDKLNFEKKKLHEVKNNEKFLYDNIRCLKELLKEKEKRLEIIMNEKICLLNKIEETNDTDDDELNKTEDSMDGNLTEDDGPLTQSEEGELNRTTESLEGNLTEDDNSMPPNVDSPIIQMKKINDSDLSKTASIEDLTQDTVSTNDTLDFKTMNETKEEGLSSINRTVSTINDGSVTITRPKNKIKLTNNILMNSVTQSTMDNDSKPFDQTTSTINHKEETTSCSEGPYEMLPEVDKYLPKITETLIEKISTIVSSGLDNEIIAKQLADLIRKTSLQNCIHLAESLDVEYNIMECTLENYQKAFEIMKNSLLKKNNSTASKSNQIKSHFETKVKSVEFAKSELNNAIASYKQQVQLFETLQKACADNVKELWDHYHQLKEKEDQFVMCLDSYRKLRIHYKRLHLNSEEQIQKAKEEQENNSLILKLNIKKIQKDIEEHMEIVKNKEDEMHELELMLESYLEKIDGENESTT
uniref:RING-type domain-containing protein n=1 Tax=Parastrongyloides trichosuri TaxID=131310 RepID=A0A0N4Z9A1_PARTI